LVCNEDIIVSFEGDATIPGKGPALSIAAAIYKGGMQIRSLDDFLSCSVKVEDDAAVHCDQLAESMAACGNADVASLFSRLAGLFQHDRQFLVDRGFAERCRVFLRPAGAEHQAQQRGAGASRNRKTRCGRLAASPEVRHVISPRARK